MYMRPGGVIGKMKLKYFFQIFFFHGHLPGLSASFNIKQNIHIIVYED